MMLVGRMFEYRGYACGSQKQAMADMMPGHEDGAVISVKVVD